MFYFCFFFPRFSVCFLCTQLVAKYVQCAFIQKMFMCDQNFGKTNQTKKVKKMLMLFLSFIGVILLLLHNKIANELWNKMSGE